MSECHKYAAGVPCWVDTLQPDPQAAADFYGRLFGWTFNSSDSTPETPAARYLLAESRGREVAGVAPQTGGARPTPVWNTYVSVADVDKTAKKAIDAGGRVLVAPVDVNDAGRMAVLEDPWEASIGVWEPRGRQGAQCINEAGAWAMSSLLARNVQSAVPFYQEVFGWHVQPFDAGGADAVLLRLPGYVGGLPEQPVPRDVVAVAMQDSRIEADRWLVDFWIDDVEKAVERVVDGGGSVIEPPSDAGMFRRAVLADFAGAIFTISQLIKHRNAAGNGAS